MSGDYLSNKMIDEKVHIKRECLREFIDAHEFHKAIERLDK